MAISKAAREEARRLNRLGGKSRRTCGTTKFLDNFTKHGGRVGRT